jgi:MoaA/NifB/PqqE/SkfB family radical SAM enzyme
MKIVWFPSWTCQNYTFGQSYGKKCPYCPYSLDTESNRLIYNDVETSSDERAEASDLIGFFSVNFDAMSGFLEVSGGEALLRKDLAFILSSIQHRWAMTSNTVSESGVDSLVKSGAVKRCISWSASWHPLSGREEAFAKNVKKLAYAGVPVRSTVVISKDTIPTLAESVKFLSGLPIHGINWHLDAHRDAEGLLEHAEEVVGKGIVALAGVPPSGKTCNRYGELMAVGPDGTLYQCVTFAYQNKEGICKVGPSLYLSKMPTRVEFCAEECFACCDHIKHINTEPVT